jgi:tetratricopeptide (TPR) repeat protein
MIGRKEGPMAEESKSGAHSSGMAAAMAAGMTGEPAERFLQEQTRLTRMQIAQQEEENDTRRRILKLEHVSAIMKVAFEIAVGVVAAAILVALGMAVWSAAKDKGLVVESFSVPPDLAARGLTGQVVAARLLDRLSLLQSATVSSRAPSSYANNWGGDIKLQIPDTGVSIGEFNRSLHLWLGKQTRITGEIYRTPSGIAVTARAGSNPGRTYSGRDSDLDALMQKAAESIYQATQPYRYAVYLANAGRTAESEAAYRKLIAGGVPVDRAWALIGLENIYANRPDLALARATLDRALKVKPDFFMVYTNRAGIEGQFQHDEAALAAQRKAVAIARGPRDPDMSQIAWKLGGLQGESALAGDLGDFTAQLEFDRRTELLPEFNNAVENARQNDVTTYAFLHDAAASEAAFAALPPANGELPTLQHEAARAFAQVLLGEPGYIVDRRKQFDAMLAKLGPLGAVIAARQFWPVAAYALALKGDLRAAHALVDRTPTDCDQCLRARGGIDTLEKNWAGAGYWYARAARQSPSPPFVWSDWGRMLVASGDADGAIARLEIAHGKGPHFADPLVWWGEALMLKHRSDRALAKFSEAARYAPHWGRLHLKWGEALAYLGRRDEARRQFAIAAGLHLSPAERSELARMTRG